DVRHALHRGCPGADHRDAFVVELVQIAGRVATRVGVVPPARVESVTRVSLDSGNAGQLRPVERPARHDHESRPHRIVTIGGDNPPALFLAPGKRLYLGLEASVAIQVEFFADASRVLEDFGRVRVPLLRHIPGLLEQGQVYV